MFIGKTQQFNGGHGTGTSTSTIKQHLKRNYTINSVFTKVSEYKITKKKKIHSQINYIFIVNHCS